MPRSNKIVPMGVRGRLLLAFIGISMFSLVAAASGLYSISQIGNALAKITEKRVPEAFSWLELSRRVESIVHAAPALLAASTNSERSDISRQIVAQAEALQPILKRNTGAESDDREVTATEVAKLVDGLAENLAGLDNLVKEKLLIAERKEKLVRELTKANSIAKRTLLPGARILAAQMADWNKSRDRSTSEDLDVAHSIIALIPQQKAAALVDGVNGNLLKISDSGSAEQIDVLMFPLKSSLEELTELSQGMPTRVKGRLQAQIGILNELTKGPASLPRVTKEELAVVAEAEQLLGINTQLSQSLTAKVRSLVTSANAEMADANSQAATIRNLNRNILVAVVVLSLVSSFLIVWLYVGRNVIARLTALSDSMLAIAGGNLRAPLPEPNDSDEIGRMAEALAVFRDTAIEVEEKNLREIEEARRRLVDAIENSSEGFAFYDPDDCLVLCNSRYKELLYPSLEINIEPGMPFETIVRTAVDSGLISDAGDDGDNWVEERLAVHRDPGEPHVQKRMGRWVLITERKTGDGGTVSIYSDITDLKQREEELTRKSNALEQLSNQLAKYLSPQIYDSIFAGKQEVRLVSQRKRLTVFFSDIVGFTETTEQLESEDLTRLLNQYLTEMSQIAIAHGATIDKYVGDAIVIFFGDPETRGVKEDALACVTMALAMRKRMKELEGLWKESGLENPLRCRMGISTGVCTVGNFGSEDRMDYTIIGNGVNLAARLETACTPGEILISYETHAHVRDKFFCKEQDPITVKGISHPVATFQVVESHENLGDKYSTLRADLPHLRLEIDRANMSPDEQREAVELLLKSAKTLSSE